MDDLIYDRTQADVDNDTTKGQYNASDLNRVESWCEYLKTELTTLGYPISITTKTNWTSSDMRSVSEMNRVRNNINTIKNAYYSLTSNVASASYFDFEKANNWEKILYEIDTLMNGMANYYVYSNVANAGQPRLWQNRFRHLYDGYTEYNKINYIESNGTQLIDLNIEPKPNTKFRLMLSFDAYPNKANFLYMGNQTSTGLKFAIGLTSANVLSIMANAYRSTGVEPSLDTQYIIIADFGENTQTFSLNGTQLLSADSSLSTIGGGTIYLLGARPVTSSDILLSAKIYFCEVYQDDILVAKLIPVLDTNNEPCLYDTQRKSYFYDYYGNSFLYG